MIISNTWDPSEAFQIVHLFWYLIVWFGFLQTFGRCWAVSGDSDSAPADICRIGILSNQNSSRQLEKCRLSFLCSLFPLQPVTALFHSLGEGFLILKTTPLSCLTYLGQQSIRLSKQLKCSASVCCERADLRGAYRQCNLLYDLHGKYFSLHTLAFRQDMAGKPR